MLIIYPQHMSRCPTTRKNSKPVLILLQGHVLHAVDRAVRTLDTDRSKFIRLAIREKLARHGMNESAN